MEPVNKTIIVYKPANFLSLKLPGVNPGARNQQLDFLIL